MSFLNFVIEGRSVARYDEVKAALKTVPAGVEPMFHVAPGGAHVRCERGRQFPNFACEPRELLRISQIQLHRHPEPPVGLLGLFERHASGGDDVLARTGEARRPVVRADAGGRLREVPDDGVGSEFRW